MKFQSNIKVTNFDELTPKGKSTITRSILIESDRCNSFCKNFVVIKRSEGSYTTMEDMMRNCGCYASFLTNGKRTFNSYKKYMDLSNLDIKNGTGAVNLSKYLLCAKAFGFDPEEYIIKEKPMKTEIKPEYKEAFATNEPKPYVPKRTKWLICTGDVVNAMSNQGYDILLVKPGTNTDNYIIEYFDKENE